MHIAALLLQGASESPRDSGALAAGAGRIWVRVLHLHQLTKDTCPFSITLFLTETHQPINDAHLHP